ncbi:hypothetical protein L0Y69_03470 [bacterium]|nr:hypothetical protein [bacterium]
MKKKYFIIIIVVLVLVALGIFLAGYLISRKDAPGKETGSDVGGFWGDLNPFGSAPDIPADGEGTPETGSSGEELVANTPFKPLVQLSDTATAGAAFTGIKGEYVEYVERATGHIFEVTLETLGKQRISQIIAPKMHEALWVDAGKTILLRYLREDGVTITSFARKAPERIAPISAGGEGTEAEGALLPDGILHAIISQDGKTAFYIKKDSASGKLFGYAGGLRISAPKKVFEHDFTEWLPVGFDGKTVWLQTKASRDVPGFLYALNTATGALSRIFGGMNGMNALPSPDGKKILYSESTRGSVKTFLYDVATAESAPFPVATLPEKCVWQSAGKGIYCAVPDRIPTGSYPDDWYMGLMSFTDKIFWINAGTLSEPSMITDPRIDAGSALDITNMALSPADKSLVFINKKDSTLWFYRMGE